MLPPLANCSTCTLSVRHQLMKSNASLTCCEPLGTPITSPPAKEEVPVPSFEGNGATPKSILGNCCFKVPTANDPVPCMPILPVLKGVKKFVPGSALAAGGTSPAAHMLW